MNNELLEAKNVKEALAMFLSAVSKTEETTEEEGTDFNDETLLKILNKFNETFLTDLEEDVAEGLKNQKTIKDALLVLPTIKQMEKEEKAPETNLDEEPKAPETNLDNGEPKTSETNPEDEPKDNPAAE